MHKNISKRNVIEENHDSNKFLNYQLIGFTKFLNNSIKFIKQSYPQHVSQFFYLLEKAKYFCAKNLSTKKFWHEFERLLSELSVSVGLHIPPNLELIHGNWHRASCKKMKDLESNCLWNFLLNMKFLKKVR